MGMDTAGIKAEDAIRVGEWSSMAETEDTCQKAAGRIRFPKFKAFN